MIDSLDIARVTLDFTPYKGTCMNTYLLTPDHPKRVKKALGLLKNCSNFKYYDKAAMDCIVSMVSSRGVSHMFYIPKRWVIDPLVLSVRDRRLAFIKILNDILKMSRCGEIEDTVLLNSTDESHGGANPSTGTK